MRLATAQTINQLAMAKTKIQQAGNDEAAVAADKELLSNFEYSIDLIGDVITEEEIWACTTCRNCEDQCPVSNEHVDKIIDMRCYLVLTEGKVAPEAQRTSPISSVKATHGESIAMNESTGVRSVKIFMYRPSKKSKSSTSSSS